MARTLLARIGVAAAALGLSLGVAPVAGAVPTTTSTTAPGSWSGSSYVSSASGTVSTAGTPAGSPAAAPAAAPPLTQVPAGLAPTDRLELAAEVLIGAAAAGAVGLGYELRRVRRRPGRHSVAPGGRSHPGGWHRGRVLVAAAAVGAVVPVAPVAVSAASAAPAKPLVVVSTATGELRTGPAVLTEVRGPDAGVGQPTRVAIAAIGVDAQITPAAVDRTGALQVPQPATTVGWWAAGPVPGAATGTAVLASHVQYGSTEGAFSAISLLRPGAGIVVSGAEGTQTYAVSSVTTYAKSALPSASLFTATGPGRLALVTCGGAYDRLTGHYADEVVVVATPLGSPSGATAG